MAGSNGNNNTDDFRLLWDEYCFVAGLTKSEKLAGELLQFFLEEGGVDRDGRDRYRIWQIEALPGGAPSPYDGSFWRSDHELGIHCEIIYRDSSARWTGPVSAEWVSGEAKVFGRKTAEYRIKMIRLRHDAVMDFLRGAGVPLPVQQPTETAVEPTVEPTQSQSELEVTSEAADTVAISSSVATFGTLAAGEVADTAMFAGKRKKKGPVQLELARVAKELWPPDGIVPLKFAPNNLQHAAEELYKREAAAKSQATGKQEKPPGPPSWPSCKRFLEAQRGT